MINFQNVLIFEVQFTPATFPLLLLQKSCLRLMHHGMRFETLAPIKHVAIIWRGTSLHLGVSLDSCLRVHPQFCAFWCFEHVFALLFRMPVFLDYPLRTFLRMSHFCPTGQLDPQDRITSAEGL